jgi:hypothetical protein
MKKLVLALAAVFALAAIGCQKEEKKAPPATDPAKTDPAAKPADPAAKPADPAAKPADPAAQPAAPTGQAGDMPAECKEYAEKMNKCLQAPEFPAAAKAQTEQAFKTMTDGWANLGTMPAEAKETAMKAAGDSCKQAMDGMKQAGGAMCPGVW